MLRRPAYLYVAVGVAASLSGVWPTAASASLLPVQTSKGTVDLTVGSADNGTTSVYTVHFRGPITDHGWTHTGTLTAIGYSWPWTASMANMPILDASTGDGKVTGTCAGISQAAAVDETVSGDGPVLDVTFGCVLSRNGSTPWEVSLQSVISQAQSVGPWTGIYVEDDTATPQVNQGSLTYGDVQFGYESADGAQRLGPLRFSGQIDIGGALYRGDLASGLSDWVTSDDLPPVAVSGSSNGMTVSGTCSGIYDETSAQAGLPSYEFDCSLAVGPAAPVAVSLKSVFDGGTGGACSYRDCWGDEAGYFTAG